MLYIFLKELISKDTFEKNNLLIQMVIKTYVTCKMPFFATPFPPLSHVVIFSSNPLSLCESLKSDKLWRQVKKVIYGCLNIYQEVLYVRYIRWNVHLLKPYFERIVAQLLS